jgi:GTP-binding protein HflX
VVVNKVDLLGPASRRRAISALSGRYPTAVALSATQRIGLPELLHAIDRTSRDDAVPLEILVPYGRERVLAELRKIGGVERTEYVEGGTKAWGWAPRHAAPRFVGFAVNGKA